MCVTSMCVIVYYEYNYIVYDMGYYPYSTVIPVDVG